jgi:hypothetical protein
MKTTRFFALALAAGALALFPGSARAADAGSPQFAGTWRLVPERSTDLSPWKTFDMTISVDGPRITIRNKLASGNRAIDTLEVLDLSREISLVPIPWWTDNRHIGAYIGGDRAAHDHASWLDESRILRTDANLVLDSQQGPHPVNILTDYKLSPSGSRLTMVQLRSTRDIPIVYVFSRVNP